MTLAPKYVSRNDTYIGKSSIWSYSLISMGSGSFSIESLRCLRRLFDILFRAQVEGDWGLRSSLDVNLVNEIALMSLGVRCDRPHWQPWISGDVIFQGNQLAINVVQ